MKKILFFTSLIMATPEAANAGNNPLNQLQNDFNGLVAGTMNLSPENAQRMAEEIKEVRTQTKKSLKLLV